MATAAKLKSADKSGKDSEEATEAKSKKKLIMIAAGAALLLALGGYFFLAPGGSDAAAKPTPGAVLAMDPITINLSGGHYLKLKLALQGTSKAGEELDGSKALDLAVDEFSYKAIEELASNKAREKLKAELIKEVVEVYEGEVMDIYFTEFVMQ